LIRGSDTHRLHGDESYSILSALCCGDSRACINVCILRTPSTTIQSRLLLPRRGSGFVPKPPNARPNVGPSVVSLWPSAAAKRQRTLCYGASILFFSSLTMLESYGTLDPPQTRRVGPTGASLPGVTLAHPPRLRYQTPNEYLALDSHHNVLSRFRRTQCSLPLAPSSYVAILRSFARARRPDPPSGHRNLRQPHRPAPRAPITVRHLPRRTSYHEQRQTRHHAR
jgi:hypothetical protein